MYTMPLSAAWRGIERVNRIASNSEQVHDFLAFLLLDMLIGFIRTILSLIRESVVTDGDIVPQPQ
jgi:hypothetical protein